MRARGFMLLEMLVALALLSMLMLGVLRLSVVTRRAAQRQEAVISLEELRLKAEFYHLEHGAFPLDAVVLRYQPMPGSRWGALEVSSQDPARTLTLTLVDRYDAERRCALRWDVAEVPAVSCSF